MSDRQQRRRSFRADPATPFGTDNYYELLEIPFGASRKDVTIAFRKAMKEWHPDRVQAGSREKAEEFSKRLNLAYSVLSDPVRRQEYDQRLRVEAMQAQIMDQYVPGFSGFGMGGPASPAHAPKRDLSPREWAELRQADRKANLSLIGVFGMLLVLGLILLLTFSIVSSVLDAVM